MLVLVMICSLAGSLVPQGREGEWYTQSYQETGPVILALGINNLFQTWYFIALLSLLCVNLTFCSIIRFGNVNRMKKKSLAAAGNFEGGKLIGTDAADSLVVYFTGKHYHRRQAQDTAIFYKNMSGFYGSFIVHLSLLLILIFGGLVLGLSDVADYSLMPGETLILSDGTNLELDNFRITDDKGRMDYASVIGVTSPNNGKSIRREISVNKPLTFGSFKFFQHSYGTAGSVTAVNVITGGADLLYLTEKSFLSGDGRNGIWFEALYPGYVEDEDGHIVPLVYRDANIYPNPIYQVLVSDGGTMTPRLVVPGDTVQTGDISFAFNEPVNYPGIRVKRIPNPFLTLLYASFALMIAGFWLCFFHIPAVVIVRRDSYAVTNLKATVMQFELDAFIDKEMHP